MIRHVESGDKAARYAFDGHLPETGFDEKVRNRQGYVCIEDGKIIGILRYVLFWDTVSFCNLLFIDSGYRRRGFGKQLMEHWEQEMKAAGNGMVMLSTQVDEDAQHFYRKSGLQGQRRICSRHSGLRTAYGNDHGQAPVKCQRNSGLLAILLPPRYNIVRRCFA